MFVKVTCIASPKLHCKTINRHIKCLLPIPEQVIKRRMVWNDSIGTQYIEKRCQEPLIKIWNFIRETACDVRYHATYEDCRWANHHGTNRTSIFKGCAKLQTDESCVSTQFERQNWLQINSNQANSSGNVINFHFRSGSNVIFNNWTTNIHAGYCAW